LGVGAAALPALPQSYLVIKKKQDALWSGFMAPPRNVVEQARSATEFRNDELSKWHLQYHSYFELGTLYTMIAGLLNILAIYDAVSGPVLYALVQDKTKTPSPPDPRKEA
jgi:hypothetical protein